MSDDVEAVVTTVLRKVVGRAVKFHRKGVRLETIALAFLMSTRDIASQIGGMGPAAAIQWMRKALDVMERDLIAKPEGSRHE